MIGRCWIDCCVGGRPGQEGVDAAQNLAGFGLQFFEKLGGVALIELEGKLQGFGPSAQFIGGQISGGFGPMVGEAAKLVCSPFGEVFPQLIQGGAMGGSEGFQGGSQFLLGACQPAL